MTRYAQLMLVLLVVPAAAGQGLVPEADLVAWQWNLELTGLAKLSPEAPTGAGVIVAVLDSGLWRDHPDLHDVHWTHPGYQLPDLRALDDPYDGDEHGWDFCLDAPLRGKPGFGHGTAVGGTIASQGIGVLGAAPGVRIMDLVVICDDNDYPARDRDDPQHISAVREAMRYAIDHGADIIHMSLQHWSDPATGQVRAVTDLFEEEFQAAYDAGILIVGATGNDGRTASDSPGDMPHVLAVGATERCDYLASYSNGGFDLLAPGWALLPDLAGAHAWQRGTSFAAPLVTGVAARLLEREPTLTPDEVRQAILGAAHETGQGHPRLDVHDLFDVPYVLHIANITYIGPDTLAGRDQLRFAVPDGPLPLFVQVEIVGRDTFCFTTRDAFQVPIELYLENIGGEAEVRVRFFDGRTGGPWDTFRVAMTEREPQQGPSLVRGPPAEGAREAPVGSAALVLALAMAAMRRR